MLTYPLDVALVQGPLHGVLHPLRLLFGIKLLVVRVHIISHGHHAAVLGLVHGNDGGLQSVLVLESKKNNERKRERNKSDFHLNDC